MNISEMTDEQKVNFILTLEKDCEYRSELPGNTGPACLGCPSCRKHLEEVGLVTKLVS